MEPLALTLALAALIATGVAVRRLAPKRREPQVVRLRFAADVTEAEVRAALAGLAGLPRRTRLVLDVLATHEGIEHRLAAEPGAIDMVRSQMRGLLPGLRMEPIAPGAVVWTGGVELTWSDALSVLRDEEIGPAASAVLGALQPLGEDEALLLRWQLSPGHGPSKSWPSLFAHEVRSWVSPERDDHIVRALPPVKRKLDGPLLVGRAVVAVRTADAGRARHLTGRVVAPLRSRQGVRGHLRQRRRSAARIERLLAAAPANPVAFSPAEVAPMIAWPIDGPTLPGLQLSSTPHLMASHSIPASGRVLGRSDWPGAEDRLLAQPISGGATNHMLIAGPSGVGKSSFIASLVAQDVAAKRACLVLDGKGDLADQLLGLIPPERHGDVIVLDPARGGRVPGLSVFARGHDPETTADLLLGVFRDLFASSWGVRSDQWIRAGLVLLAAEPSSTLADFPFVFSGDAYRARLVGRLRDPMALATWAAYEAMSPGERAQALASPLNKIAEVVGRRTVRAVLAQPAPKVDIGRAMNAGKVVIVRLSPGEIGSPAARLLGALFIHQVFAAVQARAAIEPAKRRPALLYIDEPKVLGDLPVPIDSLYELARGMNVGVATAVQSLSQLPKALARAITTNAATIVAFRQAREDARLLASELPGVTPEGLQAVAKFSAVMRIGLGPGDVAPPATVRTVEPPRACTEPEQVRAASAERYGADPDEVDAALARRHGLDSITAAGTSETISDEAPLGRRRRAA